MRYRLEVVTKWVEEHEGGMLIRRPELNPAEYPGEPVSVTDITHQPAEMLIPDPNSLTVAVECGGAVRDLIGADPRFVVLTRQELPEEEVIDGAG